MSTLDHIIRVSAGMSLPKIMGVRLSDSHRAPGAMVDLLRHGNRYYWGLHFN
jgi:hypothetical protein